MNYGISGGCTDGAVPLYIKIILCCVAVLVIIYFTFLVRDLSFLGGERMCGSDQSCPCAGNETMVGSASEDNMSRQLSGY